MNSTIEILNFVERRLLLQKEYFSKRVSTTIGNWMVGWTTGVVERTLEDFYFVLFLGKKRNLKEWDELKTLFYQELTKPDVLSSQVKEILRLENKIKNSADMFFQNLRNSHSYEEIEAHTLMFSKEYHAILDEIKHNIKEGEKKIQQLNRIMVSLIDKSLRIVKKIIERQSKELRHCVSCEKTLPSGALYCGFCGRRL